jgi:pimeloyl-ACP methyl ester carboxylesterase
MPSLFRPVFYGVRDYPRSRKPGGAPVDIRVLYPTKTPPPHSYGPPELYTDPVNCLPRCYPLIVFAHGSCDQMGSDRLQWTGPLSALAKAGFIVVLPEIKYEPYPYYSGGREVLLEVIDWAEAEFACGWDPVVTGTRAIGLAGHSFGGIAAMRAAADHPRVRAYASLGGFFSWISLLVEIGPANHMVSEFSDRHMPSLFVCHEFETNGKYSFDYNGIFVWPRPAYPTSLWMRMPAPAYALVFDPGSHGHYLPPNPEAYCHPSFEKCAAAVRRFTVDMMCVFFSRYMAGVTWPASAWTDPLEPPTPEDSRFAGADPGALEGYMLGMKTLLASEGCTATLTARELSGGEMHESSTTWG